MKRSNRLLIVVAVLIFICLYTFGVVPMQIPKWAHAMHKTSTFWLQTMDSCRQAIPGAYFVLQGHGRDVTAGPTVGSGPTTVTHGGSCPIQRGDCITVPTGCIWWDVPIPGSGTVTYTITETKSPATYEPCTGGSVCTGGPVTVTLTIDSTGKFSATAYNVYPDGYAVTWPTTGAPYTATPADPVVVHNFGIGTGSCDGDNDADDHLTGSPSLHCDNDKD